MPLSGTMNPNPLPAFEPFDRTGDLDGVNGSPVLPRGQVFALIGFGVVRRIGGISTFAVNIGPHGRNAPFATPVTTSAGPIPALCPIQSQKLRRCCEIVV